MSAALLKYPLKPNEISDDIESFFHLLVLYSLRFHRHDLEVDEVRGILEGEYDSATYSHGYWTGGGAKWRRLVNGVLPCIPEDAPVFAKLLKRLFRVCQQHYASLAQDQKLAQYALPRDRSSSQNASPKPTASSEMDDDDDDELMGCFED